MNLLPIFSFETSSHLSSLITLPDFTVSSLDVLTVISIVTSLVLFSQTAEASTHATLVTQQDDQTAANPLVGIDLFFYRNAGRHVGLGVGIICDRNDSTGASLLALSMGNGYPLTNHNGVHGIKIHGGANLVKDVTTGEIETVKFPVFTAVLLAHQARGVVVTSLGQPIASAPGRHLTLTNLFVR